MFNIYDLSGEVLNNLATLPDSKVKSLGLGLEKGIGAKDCPFIRVVPIEATRVEYDRLDVAFDIYIGTNDKNDFDNLYQNHFELEQLIKERLDLVEIEGGVLRYQTTLTDSDVIPHLKVSVLNFVLTRLNDD